MTIFGKTRSFPIISVRLSRASGRSWWRNGGELGGFIGDFMRFGGQLRGFGGAVFWGLGIGLVWLGDGLDVGGWIFKW